MTGVIQIGPLVLATDRFVAVGAIWAFAAAVPWLLGRGEAKRNTATWLALGAGLFAARVGYVASHWSAFAADPPTIFYLWQGGFSAAAGIVSASAVLVLTLKGARSKLKALGATAAIAGIWLAITLAIAPKTLPLLPPGLSARQINGQIVALDQMRGTPFVLNLWATWCPPCRREMPMLASVAKSRANPPIFFVNQGENAAAVAGFLEKNNLVLPRTLLDQSSSFSRALGGGGLPTTIFVDANGRVRRSHFGEISRAALEEGLNQITTKD